MKKKFYFLFIILFMATSWGCDEKVTTDLLDSMVATYSVTETWMENNVSMSRPTFTMNVVKSFQSADKVLLNNFGNYGVGTTVEATVIDNALTITKQTLPNTRTVEGSGSKTYTSIDFTYTETQGTVSVTITATCKKL
jgi:hypothetical protein